jgi:flagellar hook protein FlgE
MYAQTLRSASAPSNVAGGIGGLNPMQVGLGVRIGSIDMDMSPSNIESTGNKSDLAIDGTGYFVLRVGDTSQLIYTRAGNFSRDGAGFLTHTGTGNRLQGYVLSDPDDIGSISGSLTDLQIPASDFFPANPTTEAIIFGNLDHMEVPKWGPDPDDPENTELVQLRNTAMQLDVFDQLGGKHQVLAEFRVSMNTTPEQPRWEMRLSMVSPFQVISEPEPEEWIEIAFDRFGRLDEEESEGLEDGPFIQVTIINNEEIDYEALGLDEETFRPPGGIPAGGDGDEDGLTFRLDLRQITQLAGKTDVLGRRLDGNEFGSLTNWDIDENGVINLFYSNGERRAYARVALANFANDQALSKISDTTFMESNNSGAAVIGVANTGEFGKTVANGVEMSNVDLAYEFTNLVVTQRGYQANARVISTSDEILQELVNIKR